MAHLLQGLILFAAAAAAADFSHRTHLALKLECVQCHASVASSARAEDNNLPKIEACRPCHENPSVKNQPRATFVAKFSHEQHLKFGNIAPLLRAAIDRGTYLSSPGDLKQRLAGANQCTACHAGTTESVAGVYPAMATCLVCHNQVEAPFSCAQCHIPGPRLMPADHVTGFLDAHSRKTVVKTECAVCHGRTFTCAGCH